MLALSDLLVVVSAAGVTALLALRLLRVADARPVMPLPDTPEPMVLLFDDGILHHGTTRALNGLALLPGVHVWDDVRLSLLRRFPDFPDHPEPRPEGRISLFATDGASPRQVVIHWRRHLCWVTLISDDDAGTTIPDPDTIAELTALRRTSDTTPGPVWHEDAEGKLCWQNEAYATLREMVLGKNAGDAPLFVAAGGPRPNRYSLRTDAAAKPDWYDVTKVSVEGLTIHHATCVNAVVQAEEAQRNFVQTLAKTFAHLNIGLAIFDRNQQLVLFNPALVDLTGLPVQFLSVRPTMQSFFDQLREKRRMPEPKNYLTWRQEIADVIAAATDGQYHETWSLEAGQTYSVTGRRRS